MGKLTPSFKKAVFDEVIQDITSNTSHYYAFASNPVPYPGDAPEVTNDDYSVNFENDWKMLFGKKLANTDFSPIITKRIWTSGTAYSKYDNTDPDLVNKAFYVICEPQTIGGYYHVYKCIDNSNNAISTQNPGSIGTPTQPTTFQTPNDGYKWRYVSSISTSDFNKFATVNYSPIYANSTVQSLALDNCGLETIVVANSGSGYSSYHDGIIQAIPNTSSLVLSSNASTTPGFYVNNSIYIYSSSNNSFQLFNITGYTVSGSVKTIQIDGTVNTSLVTASESLYKISPRVVIQSNSPANNLPLAYSTINAVSNSISKIVILNSGSRVTWANVSLSTNPSYGSGANLYAIVPPPGGHGSDPAKELNMLGMAVSVTFSGTESNTIPVDVTYNKIGLLKNPYSLNQDLTKGNRLSSNTFIEVFKANTIVSNSLQPADVVRGVTSGSYGIVAWANSSQIHLVGDKNFIDGETIKYANGIVISAISIVSIGDVYSRDIYPLYVQNINNVTRQTNQSETFRLIIKL